jgi:uncharacterized protein (TIGR03083 family)
VSPEDHLAWVTESVEWLLAVPAYVVDVALGNCPGWTIATLLDHLGRGVGRGYAAMIGAPAGADAAAVMSGSLGPPTNGRRAHALFAETMPAFVELLARTPPDRPCATYQGPGVAAFWRRKAAVELSLHTTDVADALGRPFAIDAARAVDAIDETVTFALPLALALLDESPQAVRIVTSEAEWQLGDGQPVATVRGSPDTVLLGLYGRRSVDVAGDDRVAREWLGLIGRAF